MTSSGKKCPHVQCDAVVIGLGKAAKSRNTNRLRCAVDFKYDILRSFFLIYHRWENKFETQHYNYVLFFFLSVCKLSTVHVILWCLRFFCFVFYIFFKKMPNKNVSFKQETDMFFLWLFLQRYVRALSVGLRSLLAFFFLFFYLPAGSTWTRAAASSICFLLALHSPTVRRQEASKLLSARAGNDSNSSSDFYLESGRRENTAHICYEFTLLIAALLTAKEISYSLVS